MNTLASLVVRATTEGVDKAKADLEQLRTSAEHAQTAATGLGPAVAAASQQVAAGGTAARAAVAAYRDNATQLTAASLSATKYTEALRTLPMQVNDLAASLASAQPALLSALGRSSLLRESFGGLGRSLSALALALPPPVRLILAAAAAMGTLAKAMQEGAREGVEFHRALILSGNAAGVTAGQLALMAARLDEIGGSRGQAADVLAQLAATGKVAGDNLLRVGEAVTQAQRSLKMPVEETIKLFDELGQRPVAASLKLQEQYGYLTAATYAQTRALEKQGDTAAAASIAQQAFAEALIERAAEAERRLDTVSRKARDTKGLFADLVDLFRKPFQTETNEEELDRLRTARGDRPLGSGYSMSVYQQRPQRLADRREMELQREVDAERRVARERAEMIRDNNREIAAMAEAERQKAQGKDTARALFGVDLAAIQRDLDASVAQYAGYEAILSAERSAGLVAEETYYGERRKLIEQNRDTQIGALQSEIALIERQKVSGAELIANQQRIAELQAQIANLRGDAVTQLKVLTIEEEGAGRAAKRAFEEANRAAEAYLETISRQNARALAGMGQGTRQRDIDAGRNAIEDRYANQRRDVENNRAQLDAEGKLTDSARRQFDARLVVIDEAQRRELAMYEDHQKALEQVQGDFTVGAREALANYADEASNVARSAQEVFERAFRGMEDSLVSFVMTGKLDFKSLADSIIADLIRVQAKTALSTIFQGLSSGASGGLLSSIGSALAGAFGGAKAEGGPVSAGKAYLVGERGPEIIIPSNEGTVVPNHRLGMGGPQITINAPLHPAPGMTVAQVDALLQRRNDELEARIMNNLSRSRAFA